MTRSETRLSDFDAILQRAAYNVEGGLQKSPMISSHLIDHFIPFLPLQQEHVTQCISAEFKNQGKPYSADTAA